MQIDLDNLRLHITNNILNDSNASIQDDQDLLLSGMLDSLGILKLVSYLENKYEVTIPPEDVLIDHFSTLGHIQSYMTRH